MTENGTFGARARFGRSGRRFHLLCVAAVACGSLAALGVQWLLRDDPASTIGAPHAPTLTAANDVATAKDLGDAVAVGDQAHGTVEVTIDRLLTDPGEVGALIAAPSGPPPGQSFLVVGARLVFHAGTEADSLAGIDAALAHSLHEADGSTVPSSECFASVTDDLASMSNVVDGVPVQGNLCFLVPEAATHDDLLLRLQDPWCQQGCSPVWVQLSG